MDRVARRVIPVGLQAAAMASALLALAPRAAMQQTAEAPGQEIVANLAAGRVIVAVVKDAIIVGTIENPIEVQTRVPTPVVLGSERVGVILGAVEWVSPSSQREIARLDRELPRLRSHVGTPATTPHLVQPQEGAEALDLEVIGQGLLERLNDVTQEMHARVDWPPSEPVVELIIADYLGGYGPEVWQLSYNMEQDEQQADYWNTRILRPVYVQFWPPEKGQPRTLIEFDYPPENAPSTLLDLLRGNDPRLAGLRSGDPKLGDVANRFIQGESAKIAPEDATLFLRAALSLIAPRDARETMAVINEETGVAWVLPPPAEPPAERQQEERPPGAPSLLNPPAPR